MAIIETKNLTKIFKELIAVNDLSLEIEEKECFGLLGPNGAGKTSLIRMITGISPATSGEIRIMGKNLASSPRELKPILGVVPQIDNLDTDLNVVQNLVTFARYFNITGEEARRRSQDILKLVQLEDKQNNRLKELSGGMKRRLLIGRGLINQPKILVLDEPSIGLDPQSRHLVWQKLRELKSQGVTLLLCTQNMDEAEILCDRVAIMHQGQILEIDTPQGLISRHAGSRIWEIDFNPEERERIISELEKHRLEYEEDRSTIHVFHTEEAPAAELSGLPTRIRPASLEDVFFRLTGRLLSE